MSVLVPVIASEVFAAEQAVAKPVVRRRMLLVGITLLLVVGVAAVPMPVRSTYYLLLTGVNDLEKAIVAEKAEGRKLVEWEQRLNVDPDALAHTARVWLSDVGALDLRNRLIAVATGCGLELESVSLEEGLTPLGSGGDELTAPRALSAVAVDDEDDEDDEGHEADADIAPPQLSAVRYSLQGRGSLSSLLLFTGLLAELPAPLRLLDVDLRMQAGVSSFVLRADRLASPLVTTAGAGEGVRGS